MRVLAEIIACDVSLLVTFNYPIDGALQNNPTAKANPEALAQLDGYNRPLYRVIFSGSAWKELRKWKACKKSLPI